MKSGLAVDFFPTPGFDNRTPRLVCPVIWALLGFPLQKASFGFDWPSSLFR